MKKKWIYLLLTGVVAAGIISWFRTIQTIKAPHLEKQTRVMMDTYVTISAWGTRKEAQRAVNLALDRMQEIDTKFNAFNPKSPLYAFNEQGIPISDKEILNLVRIALEVSKASDGAFDITTFSLTKLWGFNTKSPKRPTDEQIKEALKKVGYTHLLLRNGKLNKDEEGVAIDLGGIAKGYAVAEAVRLLKSRGITSALIDAGGDIYALGKKGDNFWKVGIRHPRQKNLLGYVEVENSAVMSSGDYERFFKEDDKRYHHIFNPRIGYPTRGLSAITVICPDPVIADAWATALFVIGWEKGMEIVENLADMEAVMVTDQGKILTSSGLKNKLKVIPKNR